MSANIFIRSIAGSAILTAGILLALISCTGNGEIDPEQNDSDGQSGYLVGKVTDPAGNALPDATIFTENTVYKNRGAEVSSSSDGTYKLSLVAGLGQWTAKGYILKAYNGKVYKINLHPDNTASFTEDEKPVRNFQWKLQGHIADKSLDLYYGGTAELYRDLNSELRDSENVEFTFRPDGPLIDGSGGKVLKLRCGKSGTSGYNLIKDIPIGRYKVSAVYVPTGQSLRVTDAWNDGTYYPEVTMEFYGTDQSYRSNQMGIGYTDL
ncbi:carboxypeptidase regulatory-like domain-containing protein [Dyadobacter flavalbus]|uniref:Carboxypeptidase regulatory-like domain-containing protein n=1 Tax=Dyadobacter flavalbus TaxID=2579942 RepID=A0A5M8R0T2_9BACT|nr:carboxypeptidase-like regulatory domain-containing protein [Dyadobacter flavalbus]KAA6439852.1 carboxypeptidase regulatory-like domain-containing protein [Dyadobacter flavalbus]